MKHPNLILQLRAKPLSAVLLVIGLMLAGGVVANAQETQIVTEYTVQPSTLTVTLRASGNLEPLDMAELAFVGSAPVDEVYVAPGDIVETGDVLATLNTADLQAQLLRAEIALRDAENNLNQLTAPPLEIDIRVAQAAIETAILNLEHAQRQGATAADIRIAELQIEQARNALYQQQLNRDIIEAVNPEFRGGDPYAEAIEREGRLDSAETGIAVAQADYARTVTTGANLGSVAAAEESLLRAELALENLLEGPGDLEIARAEMNVNNAALDLERLEANLAQSQIVAPFDGVVAAENLTPGAYPPANQPPITVIDNSGYRLTLAVDEADIGGVQVGQDVNVTVDALPGETLTGTVSRVGSTPITGSIVTYNVEVTLNPTEAAVRLGMSVSAEIAVGEIMGAITVPNGFISIDAATGQARVTVANADGSFEQRAIEIGQRTDSETHIEAGLQPGETVVILAESDGGVSINPFGLGE